jgi:hypothetical protein
MSHLERARAAVNSRDDLPELDTPHARRGKARCGITSITASVRVTCTLPVMHVGNHQGGGVTWPRAGITSLIEVRAA